MAQEITNDQASGQASQPQLVMQKIYVKDVSFEAPNAPQIFQEIDGQDQPQVQLNLGQKATDLGNNLYEVVLSLTLTCTVGQRTAYLAEVEQAGLGRGRLFPGSWSQWSRDPARPVQTGAS